MLDAVFHPDGELLVPTELARGPWDPRAQHGGAASGVLGRAIERCDPVDGLAIVRVVVDLLRPVPLAPLRIEAHVERGGRRVQLVDAALLDGDRPVARASAWRMRVGDDVVPGVSNGAPPPGPETGHSQGAHTDLPGFWRAVEWRFVTGSFDVVGPATGWARLTVPLVAGEEPSPLQRVLVAADFGNGISSMLDFMRYMYVNVELSVHLHRLPRGEWICLDAETSVDRTGIGVTRSTLHDLSGPIGNSAQSLLVDRRPD